MSEYFCVIPTIGRSELSLRALPSVLAQRKAFGEIVVVCDRKGADLGAARAQLERSGIPFQIRFTRGGEGGPAARKLGFSAGQGDYAVFLDDDDEICKDFTAEIDRALAQYPGSPDLIIPRVLRVWSEGCIPPSYAKAPLARRTGSGLLTSEDLARWQPATSSGLLVSRHAFHELPVDARIKGFNDLQLIRNVSHGGGSLGYAGKAVVRFYQYFSDFRMTSDIRDRLENLRVARSLGMQFSPESELNIRASAALAECRAAAYKDGIRGLTRALRIMLSEPEFAEVLRSRRRKVLLQMAVSLWLCGTRWVR